MDVPRDMVDSFYIKQFTLYKCLGLFQLPDYYSSRWHLAFKLYFWHVTIFWMLLFDVSMWMKIITSISDLNEIIKVAYLSAMAIAVMAKFARIRIKNKVYLALFAEMHSDYLLPANRVEMEKLSQSVEMSRKVRNGYMSLSLFALFLVFVTQLISDPFELPLSLYIPIDVEKLWRFIIVYLYQLIGLSICCFMNIAFDSLSAALFIYLKGQLDILSNRLENIGRNQNISQEIVTLQLKACLRYYAKILQLAQVMEDLFSISMSVQVMSSVLVLVANFYAMTFLTDPSDYATFSKFLVYQLTMITQIFILCYFANEVSLKSVELSHALYSSEWTHCNQHNRKLMLLMMGQFDQPIRIKTINRCYCFNLAAFTSIVNSSYSYYALLKKMKD